MKDLEGEDLDNERRRFGFEPDKPYWDRGSGRVLAKTSAPSGAVLLRDRTMKMEIRNNKPVMVDEQGIFPSKVVVCPSCDGSGSTLIPGMRGHAYTSDQLDELGDEFVEAMMGGDYDTVCDECQGLRVSALPIISGLSDKDQDRLTQAFNELDQEYAARREQEAERRAGA